LANGLVWLGVKPHLDMIVIVTVKVRPESCGPQSADR
jgi:hypothetical protein